MLSIETLSLAKAYTDKIKEQLSIGFTPKIVDSLPAAGQNNILYLVLKENGQEEGNIYNEYIWIDNKYEFIGNTDTSFIVDSELSETSENPVQNKTITAELNNKADIDNPLSLIEANRTRIGFIIHDYAASTGERYVLNTKDGVTLDDTEKGKSKIPSSWVVGQYVQTKIAAMTPVKGIDYFTEEDKQEIINAVIAALSNNG